MDDHVRTKGQRRNDADSAGTLGSNPLVTPRAALDDTGAAIVRTAGELATAYLDIIKSADAEAPSDLRPMLRGYWELLRMEFSLLCLCGLPRTSPSGSAIGCGLHHGGS